MSIEGSECIACGRDRDRVRVRVRVRVMVRVRVRVWNVLHAVGLSLSAYN